MQERHFSFFPGGQTLAQLEEDFLLLLAKSLEGQIRFRESFLFLLPPPPSDVPESGVHPRAERFA